MTGIENPAPETLRFGIDHFGEVKNNDPVTSLNDLVKLAVHADEVGLNSFNLGEHHRDDYTVSAPDIVLSNIAARTSQIKLGTAVIVLSSDDPVRIYERFATMDALTGGRMELTVGRGSFTESFPLFGYNLHHYEELFEEKLQMLTTIWKGRPFTWTGKHTQSLTDQQLYPPVDTGRIPLYVAVGGSPQSIIRTAQHDLGLRLAIIGGEAARFAPFVDLYHRAQEQFGHAPGKSVGFHSHGLIAETDDEAREAFYPDYLYHTSRIGKERGWGEVNRARYEHELEHGALYVGSPETVARKLATSMKALGADTFNMKLGHGTYAQQMTSVELFATKVVPMVRDILAGS